MLCFIYFISYDSSEYGTRVSISDKWNPIARKNSGVSPQNNLPNCTGYDQCVPCDNLSFRHVVNESRTNSKMQQTESNALIEHLTEQIISLNQWRETAILEAVEKDRYETSIDIHKNTHRNLYIKHLRITTIFHSMSFCIDVSYQKFLCIFDTFIL